MRQVSLIIVLVLASRGLVQAAPSRVRVDPPSPPPYCADGKCYPKPTTWGHYQGRWRRWPGVTPEAAPVEPTTEELIGPDLAPYETPQAEAEDQRAPPPTPTRQPLEQLLQQPPGAEGGDGVSLPPQQPPPGGPGELGGPDAPPRPPFSVPTPQFEGTPDVPFGQPGYDSPPDSGGFGPPDDLFPEMPPAGEPLPPELHLRLNQPQVVPPGDPPPQLPVALRRRSS